MLPLDDGAKYEPISASLADNEFVSLWQHSVVEIARLLGVPPHLLFEMGRATWGNAGEMGGMFLTFALTRWLTSWVGEIRLKLLTPDERQTHYAEFETNALLRTDLSARATAYSQLIAARVINPNEARARENLPPYGGGDQFLNPNVTVTTKTTGPAE